MKKLLKNYYNWLLINPWRSASGFYLGFSARDMAELTGNMIAFLVLVLIFWCLKEEKKFK